MKTLLLAISLFACMDTSHVASPDAGEHHNPITVDAASSHQESCMGNLPNARTETLTDADPVPHGLINEIQDNIVASNFKQIPVFVAPEDFTLSVGVASAEPSFTSGFEWEFSTTVLCEVIAGLRWLTPGMVIDDILWAAVPVDVEFVLTRTAFPDSGAGVATIVKHVTGGSGTTLTSTSMLTGTTGTITLPHLVQDGFIYHLAVQAAATTPVNRFGGAELLVHRGP